MALPLLSFDAPVAPPPVRVPRNGTQVFDYLNRRGASLRAVRDAGGWMMHWRDIAEFLLPRRGAFLCTGSPSNQGRQINRSILTPGPSRAAHRCATGMNYGMTSKSRQWFNLTVEDQAIADLPAVRAWLAKCERLLRQWFDGSNLYTVLPEYYLEQAVFGTAAMLVVEDYEKLFRCELFTIGEYCLAQDHRGVANTLYREYECTVDQAVAKFGLENCSDAVQQAHKRGEPDKTLTVCHLIEPNVDAVPGRDDNRNMPFRSVYWEKASQNKDRFLRYGGFQENALLATRWATTSNDVYGRCPGMEALPEAKQLMAEIRRKGQAFERSILGTFVAPPELKNASGSLLPGSISYLDNATDASVRNLYEKYNPPLQYLLQDIAELEAKIETIFFNDLFFAISSRPGKQPLNDLELMARQDEKLTQLGAVTERNETEFLEPLIDRVWAIAERNGALPPPPREVAGKKIKVVFVGPLAQAQKSQDITSLERVTAFIGNLAKSFPDAADKFNPDGAIDEYADLTNAPPSMLRSAEEVEAIRGERAKQQKQQQAAAAATALRDVAQGAELLSRTDTGNGRTGLQEVQDRF